MPKTKLGLRSISNLFKDGFKYPQRHLRYVCWLNLEFGWKYWKSM